MDTDNMDWECDVALERLDRPVGERYYRRFWTQEDRDKAYHEKHIQANFPTRYDMACALAHCCLLEDGLPRGPMDRPEDGFIFMNYEVSSRICTSKHVMFR